MPDQLCRSEVPGGASFIHQARRRQLIQSAIAVIADVGLPAASTVRIAMHAGVSRGVLTHHFTDREDLIEAVVAEVYGIAGQELAASAHGPGSPREGLLAFVGGSVDFYAAYPNHMAALTEIFNARLRAGREGRGADARHGREMSDVAELLRAGQGAGQLRDFDPDTMAVVIRSVLDAGLQRIRQGADAHELRSELVRTVDAAITRRPR